MSGAKKEPDISGKVMFPLAAVILWCRACDLQRTIPHDPPLEKVDDLIAWLRSPKVPRCPCGASHVDIKIPLRDVQ